MNNWTYIFNDVINIIDILFFTISNINILIETAFNCIYKSLLKSFSILLKNSFQNPLAELI